MSDDGGESEPLDPGAEARQRAEAAVRDWIVRRGSTPIGAIKDYRNAAAEVEARVAGKVKVGPYDDVKLARKRIDLEDRRAILGMKKVLARGAFLGVGLQVLIADVAFFIYAISNVWDLPSAVIVSWLSATVVQTVGIVYVIARHLFPSRDAK